jgi:hypothetical protein
LEKDDQDRLLVRIQRDARHSESKRRQWTWLRPVLASAAVLALAVTAWVAYRGSSPTPQVSPPPEQTIAATPKPPVYLLPLDKPQVTLSLAALTWRGGGAENELLADLKAPLDAFRNDDYARADREFAALESRYPRAIEVFFYGGVARLFVNDPQRAIAAFARAGDLADGTFAHHVSWYRAIAEERAGRLAETRGRLDALCRGKSDHAREACRAIDRIGSSSRAPDAR